MNPKPGWDADSPRLRQNLARVLTAAGHAARKRVVPTVEAARKWQADMMAGLGVPRREFVGRFRGEPGLERVRVEVGGAEGSAPEDVPRELGRFEHRLQRATADMDARYPPGAELDADGLAAVLDMASWAHAEWVRIHPFANGNGRTARLWANSLFMRYGLPPVLRLRPRPDGGYGDAGASAMHGDWMPTVAVFRRMLFEFLGAASQFPRAKRKHPPRR